MQHCRLLFLLDLSPVVSKLWQVQQLADHLLIPRLMHTQQVCQSESIDRLHDHLLPGSAMDHQIRIELL